jgi:hypothetical protein
MQRNPANHHYIVYFEGKKPRSEPERQHLFNVNLEVYNLISIFLNKAAITELIKLLNEGDGGDFDSRVQQLNRSTTRRRYFLVGSIAAGKTTSLEALRCFTTFEEWSGRVPAIMYKDHSKLSALQRKQVDQWIYAQLRKKNERMKMIGPGIHVMDRGYLDLFAFSKTALENRSKARNLAKNVAPPNEGSLEKGHILFVEADQEALGERLAKRGAIFAKARKQAYAPTKLVKQAEILKKIYMPDDDSVFDTTHGGLAHTARRLARFILLEGYKPFDFSARMTEIDLNDGKI